MPTVTPASSGIRALVLASSIGAFLVIGVAITAQASAAEPQGACATTSRAGLNACSHEASDDYWIAIGVCANLGNAVQRPRCREEAQAARTEAVEECQDVFDARQEVCEALGQAPYDPEIDPDRFVDPGDIGRAVAVNPLLPLQAGTRYEYVGRKAGEKVVVDVTYDTIEIAGVTCRVVRDVVTDLESGELLEDTDDYFAQDVDGNVWYFGEISRNYEDGVLTDLEGSWRAGDDGARAGILMKAVPAVGDVYRQEFLLGEAEDLAEVLNLRGNANSPYTSCSNSCLVTGEFTPLEPDGFEKKYYKPGVGMILGVHPEDGEREALVRVSNF